MNYTCANCKNRRTWDCEDYNWGFWDKEACRDRFELDLDTLSKEEVSAIQELARALLKRGTE